MPVLLKLPPHLDREVMERVLASTHSLVIGYTCINTSPDVRFKDQTPIGKHPG